MKNHYRTINLGIIEIPQSMLLRLIQYPEGTIKSIDIPTERADVVRIQLEHPEMPELQTGFAVPNVTPEFTTYEDCLGHKVEVRKNCQSENSHLQDRENIHTTK